MFPSRTIYNPLFYPRHFIENDLKTPPFTMKFNKISNERRAALPGSSSPGINVYNFITEKLCRSDDVPFLNVMIEHIPNMDYLR